MTKECSYCGYPGRDAEPYFCSEYCAHEGFRCPRNCANWRTPEANHDHNSREVTPFEVGDRLERRYGVIAASRPMSHWEVEAAIATRKEWDATSKARWLRKSLEYNRKVIADAAEYIRELLAK